MYCISISYRNADIEIRKKVKFTEEDCKRISFDLIQKKILTECVILSTCNRTEIYYCAEKSREEDLIKIIAENSDIEEELLSKYVMLFGGDASIFHLFRVASGIDSMVIGEDEILGQTKNAYRIAKENNTVRYELNVIFQAAVTCAKIIKTETALSRTSVSVATLAANEAAKLGDRVNVTVIGASGKIGNTVLKNLISHKNISVKATLRSNKSQLRFIENMGVEVVDYERRYDHINLSDCVISATSSPHYTVTLYDLKKHLTEHRNRLFIDLAVPPDIDSGIKKLDGVRLINIDYFDNLAKENNAVKLDCLNEAEDIISAETAKLRKEMLFHDFLPLLPDIKDNLRDKPIESVIYKMKSDSSAEMFEEFLNLLKDYRN